MSGPIKKLRKGFAAMDRKKARSIQIKGGKAVSKNSKHMARIGRRGGKKTAQGMKQRMTPFQSYQQQIAREDGCNIAG